MNLLDAERARFVARIGGVLYLTIIVIGALGEAVVRGSIVVPGNAALVPLASSAYLNAFSPEQIGAMALLSVRSHSTGFGIALIFFGVECVILGYLIYRSGYLPRSIGVLMEIAGVCYLINSFALLLSPPLSSRLFPAVLMPALAAELSLALWLLLKGVNAEKWNRHVHSAGLAGA